MLPVALNLETVPVLLIGRGDALEKRKRQLEEAGAKLLEVQILPPPLRGRVRVGGDTHSTSQQEPPPTLTLPLKGGGNKIIFIAGLPYEESKPIADAARALGKLVNAEDINELCDFYFTANIRRGDLLIAVSTGGASPTLAKRVRDKIAALFGEAWKERTDEIAKARGEWKRSGKSMQEVAQLTDDMLAERGWLS